MLQRAFSRGVCALLVVAAIAACQFLPATGGPQLTCVDLPSAECEAQAQRYRQEARDMQPPKRVLRILISARDGGRVDYDDGSSMIWTP